MVSTSPRSRRVIVVEDPQGADMLLQDIMEYPYPERQFMLEDWLEASGDDPSGTVKIGTPDGKPMHFMYKGKVFNVPPAGKRVSRKLALELIIKYGKDGHYYGRDQRTGLMVDDQFGLTEEQEKWAARQQFNFLTNYLIQVDENEVREASRPRKTKAVIEELDESNVQEDLEE